MYEDKQTLLQDDTFNIGEYGQSCQKYSKQQVCKYFAVSQKVKDKVDFCADKHQSIQQAGTILFDGCSQACLQYSK